MNTAQQTVVMYTQPMARCKPNQQPTIKTAHMCVHIIPHTVIQNSSNNTLSSLSVSCHCSDVASWRGWY